MLHLRVTVGLATMAYSFVAGAVAVQAGVNYEEAPIHYSTARDETSITRLQQRLDSGEVALSFEEPHGYLKAVLKELAIPISSQALVFSKTSLQSDKISPKTPRAIYFNDEVHIGYIQKGVLEIAAADPLLGMVFYTLDQNQTDKPVFQRQSNRCLNCHGAFRTRGVPGVLVRSVFPDPNGQPVIAAGSSVTTHSSPLEKRWGGWYVTGSHGEQKHLGNFLLPDGKKPKTVDNVLGQNLRDLSDRFDTSEYLSPHSDLIALMVLEHQAEGYNLMTQAAFENRHALWKLEQSTGNPAAEDTARAELRDRSGEGARRLVRHFLFVDETRLESPVRGTSDFNREFVTLGTPDPVSRSVREFDLQSRLFKHSCSYLLLSQAFQKLPDPLRTETLRQLNEAIKTPAGSSDFDRLKPADREVIARVLEELTKPRE